MRLLLTARWLSRPLDLPTPRSCIPSPAIGVQGKEVRGLDDGGSVAEKAIGSSTSSFVHTNHWDEGSGKIVEAFGRLGVRLAGLGSEPSVGTPPPVYVAVSSDIS